MANTQELFNALGLSTDLSYPKIFQNTFESLEIAILKNDMLYE